MSTTAAHSRSVVPSAHWRSQSGSKIRQRQLHALGNRSVQAQPTHLARQVVTEACQDVGRDLAINEGPQHVYGAVPGMCR
jgi:hypothetical protein